MKAKRTWITIVCLGMFSLHAVASEHNSIDSSNDAVGYAAVPAKGVGFATPFLLNVSTISHAVVPLIRSYIAAPMATRFAPQAHSFTIDKTIPALSGDVSDTLNSLPMIGSMYRRTGHRFNTGDGSSVESFALCYRMSSRVGFQMVPGDPAPVKLAISSLSNNTGVTVGLTLKLLHRR